jgi:hypothetical protein
VIAEVLSQVYDGVGHPVSSPSRKRYRGFAPTFPMGRYVTQPLTIRCRDVAEIRAFLLSCQYVSDQAQFDRPDYWMPPEEFERRKRGDCDDFALWVWRQFLSLGYDSARFVAGRAGRYGGGHAWVTFDRGGCTFLVEVFACHSEKLPRLNTLSYHPQISVAWDGERLRYFEHDRRSRQLSLREVLPLLPEWLAYWCRARPRVWRRRFHAAYSWATAHFRRGDRAAGVV